MIIWIPAYAGMTMEVMSNFLMNNVNTFARLIAVLLSLRATEGSVAIPLQYNEIASPPARGPLPLLAMTRKAIK
jgi:hypothetical protein